MLLVKLIVLLLLGFVIISLFSGLYFLVKDKGQSNRTVNALSVRIGLSILAIIVVIIAGATGVIDFNPSPFSSQSTTAPRESSTEPSTEPSTSDRKETSSGRRPITEFD